MHGFQRGGGSGRSSPEKARGGGRRWKERAPATVRLAGGVGGTGSEAGEAGSSRSGDGVLSAAAAATTHDDGYAGESESVSERAGRARGDKVGIVVARLPKRATANLNSSSALHINRYC